MGRERVPVAGRLATKQNFLALVALKNNGSAGPFSDALRVSFEASLRVSLQSSLTETGSRKSSQLPPSFIRLLKDDYRAQ